MICGQQYGPDRYVTRKYIPTSRFPYFMLKKNTGSAFFGTRQGKLQGQFTRELRPFKQIVRPRVGTSDRNTNRLIGLLFCMRIVRNLLRSISQSQSEADFENHFKREPKAREGSTRFSSAKNRFPQDREDISKGSNGF